MRSLKESISNGSFDRLASKTTKPDWYFSPLITQFLKHNFSLVKFCFLLYFGKHVFAKCVPRLDVLLVL